MQLTKYEQETIISFNEGEQFAGVYTHNKALIRRLAKLAQERPDECNLENVCRGGQAVNYNIPKKWIKITPPRVLSEKQLEARRATLAIINSEPKSTLAQG